MEVNQHSVQPVLTSKESKKVRSFYISERTSLTSTRNNCIDDIASILLTTARAKPEPMAINDEEETGDNKPYDH
jgi:hypothetical protein